MISRILIDPFPIGDPSFEKTDIPLQNVIEGVTHLGLSHGHKDHVDCEIVLPCHYGTFPVIDQTPDRFLGEMAGSRVLAPVGFRSMSGVT